MAPFYSLSSYFGIIFVEFSEFFVLIRDLYEALLLFDFFYLIFAYIAYIPEEVWILKKKNNFFFFIDSKGIIDDRKAYEVLVIQKEIHHIFPFNFCISSYCFSEYQIDNFPSDF
jgi:hypothetical protein